MPALLIELANGQWFARIANTGVSYPFVGATPGIQAAHVQVLAEAMAAEDANIAAQMGQYIQIGQANPGAIYRQVFSTTDTLIYDGRVIYACVDDDYLLDELVDAGRALAAVFV